MIIKHADDKDSQIAILQSLLHHPNANTVTKKRIEQEVRNIKAGIRGEAEAAYEMKVHFGDSEKWMVIHDLRIEHDGLVAQIDHLIINRFLEIWVCESKHFSEGVAVNEHGEFAAFFGSKPYGVPSPIEQNNRHILILKRMLESGAVKLPTRLGFTIKADLKSLILVSKGARISRPKRQIDGLDTIIKNDMLFKTIVKAYNDSSTLIIAKIIGTDSLQRLAHEIASQHTPIEFNWHAKFGLDQRPLQLGIAATPIQSAMNKAEVDQPIKAVTTPSIGEPPKEAKPKQKLICNSCDVAIPLNVARYCWFNKPKFGGNLFCAECQKEF